MLEYLLKRKDEIEHLTYNEIDDIAIKEYLDIISCLINIGVYNKTFR